MKLTDILRQINEEEEEDGMKDPTIPSEYAIIPKDMGKALDALSDPDNYVDEQGTNFSLNLADRSIIDKIFGRSRPVDKEKDAIENWDNSPEQTRYIKLKDIKNREPELYQKGIEKPLFQKLYDSWKEEGNEGDIDKFIVSNDYVSGKDNSPIKLVSKKGNLTKYFPDKTGDNMKRYGGILSIDTHYDIEGDKIVFPSEKLKTWGNKDLIKRRIKSIMDNGDVEFTPSEKIDTEIPTTTKPTPEPTQSNKVTFKITLDPKKIRGNTDKIRKKIDGLKATYGKNFEYSNNVLTINNLSPEKKRDLQSFFFPYKTDLNEAFDFERYQMLRRAGIIK